MAIIKMEKGGKQVNVVDTAFEKVWKNKGWTKVSSRPAPAKKTTAASSPPPPPEDES